MRYLLLLPLILLTTGCGTTIIRLEQPVSKCEPVAIKDCKEEENFGYANGLVMAQRVLGEQNMLKENGVETENKTCEQVVEELYDFGYPVAAGYTKKSL